MRTTSMEETVVVLSERGLIPAHAAVVDYVEYTTSSAGSEIQPTIEPRIGRMLLRKATTVIIIIIDRSSKNERAPFCFPHIHHCLKASPTLLLGITYVVRSIQSLTKVILTGFGGAKSGGLELAAYLACCSN